MTITHSTLDQNSLALVGLKQHLMEAVQQSATWTSDRKQATIWLQVLPELAGNLLRYMMYATQRKLRTERVAILYDAITKQELLNNNLIWICRTATDRWNIINSQHTLQAIVQADKTIELQLVLDQVETMADVAKRYALFDIGGLRTQADIVGAADLHRTILTHNPDWYAVAPHCAARAVAIIKGAFLTARAEKIESLKLLQSDWLPEYEGYNEKLRPLVIAVNVSENQSAGVINNQAKGLRHAFRLPMVTAIFMTALKTHRHETEKLLTALVDRARDIVPYEETTVETLFNYLMTPHSDTLHTKRRRVVYANYVRCIIAYREATDMTHDDLYLEPEDLTAAHSDELWETLTDGELPRFTSAKPKIDRRKIVRGLFGKK
jgi:hypothetical protein